MEEDLALSSLLFMKICNLFGRWKRAQRRSPPKRLNRNLEQIKKNKSSLSLPPEEFWRCPNNFHWVFVPMKEQDDEEFFENTCMNVTMFNKLVSLLEPEIAESALLPEKITAEQCLVLTLEYLVKGFTFYYIKSKYKLRSYETAHDIILETCELLWKVLRETYLAEPTESTYSTIAEKFSEKWHLPCCAGAITCMKIVTRRKKNRSNYTAVLATCDHNYVFTSLCIGNKCEFENTSFGQAVINCTLPFPDTEDLTGNKPKFPYYFAGNLCMPLLKTIMRTYRRFEESDRRKIFNYRISRGYQVIDNAFGILIARMHIFQKAINTKPDDCKSIVRAAVVLHNFIMVNDENQKYCPPKFADWEDDNHSIKAGGWRYTAGKKIFSLRPAKWAVRNHKQVAVDRRDFLAAYFESKGAVEFQNEFVDSISV
ncbi:uncharacterized protein LOC101462749 [Ceratitis capitata]|uniref:DDE Tnp4 domain-containing protein n=1 Tax=Ceratitis capitata TaxID=7213 RepID=W8CE12_CERCA|nr:uncharacterized protein LOC101462749 [Ceratitis capitata]